MRNIANENGRSRHNPAKSEKELGLQFRPVQETLHDAAAWLRREFSGEMAG